MNNNIFLFLNQTRVKIFKNVFYSEIEKTKIPIKEKDRTYLNLSKEKNENILLLAVENQNHDCLYANIAKDKETSSPKKLNVCII